MNIYIYTHIIRRLEIHNTLYDGALAVVKTVVKTRESVRADQMRRMRRKEWRRYLR